MSGFLKRPHDNAPVGSENNLCYPWKCGVYVSALKCTRFIQSVSPFFAHLRCDLRKGGSYDFKLGTKLRIGDLGWLLIKEKVKA